MKATKEQAIFDIEHGDYEEAWPRSRNDKRRNCIFCETNIPKGVTFFKNYEYPYEKNLPRWFACQDCFKKVKNPAPSIKKKKVQCKDCKNWSDSGRKRKDSRYMISLAFTYRSVGVCMSVECGRETSGYTGITSGHKMTRLGEIERYCKFFEPKVNEEKGDCTNAEERCARGGFGDFFNCIWAYRKNCPQWLQELCEKAYWEAYEE